MQFSGALEFKVIGRMMRWLESESPSAPFVRRLNSWVDALSGH